MIVIRRATAEDASFLVTVLAVAADWRRDVSRPAAAVLTEPELARYVTDWPREGDLGLVAEESAIAVGAAWWRIFGRLDAGYGFVDEFTPELSVGVLSHARRRGIGAKLLQALVQEAQRSALPGLSLSVELDNPALSMYQRLGFKELHHIGGSITMTLRLTC